VSGPRLLQNYQVGSLHAQNSEISKWQSRVHAHGRIEAEDVKELRQLLTLEKTGQDVVLDLRDVTLVNQDAVKCLSGCEADSIKLENCPPYIREWIARVKGRTRRRRTR
jgi:hypothetical protein